MKQNEISSQEIITIYGPKFAEEIKERIESANKLETNYKILAFESTRTCHKIVFATQAAVYLYDVYPESGIVADRRKISYYDCKKALEVMDLLWELDQKNS